MKRWEAAPQIAEGDLTKDAARPLHRTLFGGGAAGLPFI